MRLPEGARLVSSTPPATSEDQLSLAYRLSQDADQEIVVRYRLGGGL